MDGEPHPQSLIQRRIAVNRDRALGIAAVAVSTALLTLRLVFLDLNGDLLRQLVPGIAMLLVMGTGVSLLVRSRRLRLALEAEHGPDAGKQKPVGR